MIAMIVHSLGSNIRAAEVHICLSPSIGTVVHELQRELPWWCKEQKEVRQWQQPAHNTIITSIYKNNTIDYSIH